jgi:CBS-domain-containing membrane protein
MNVAFFLTPKSQVVCASAHGTMRDALEALGKSGYTAIPVLDGRGHYVSTITEGDLLRKLIQTPNLSVYETDKVPLAEVPIRTQVHPVGIDAEVEELFSRAMEQNYVPVINSRSVFIGIVRRREILVHCAGAVRVTLPAHVFEPIPDSTREE